MIRPLSDLEKGIFVYINEIQLELLREKKGFLEKENYPDFYKEIALDNELGRFLFFQISSRGIMKTEMAMLPNGNYEQIISPIQHQCHSNDHIIECVEYGWKPGILLLKIEDGDPHEDGYMNELEIKYCPFCGYEPVKKKQ